MNEAEEYWFNKGKIVERAIIISKIKKHIWKYECKCEMKDLLQEIAEIEKDKK